MLAEQAMKHVTAVQVRPEFSKPDSTQYKYFYVDANQVLLNF
jgi:hypothetical protein